jgi:hypothetical protein
MATGLKKIPTGWIGRRDQCASAELTVKQRSILRQIRSVTDYTGAKALLTDPWQPFLRKWAILNDSLHANDGGKMATDSKPKTCRNAVDHNPISIKVEFDNLIAAHRDSVVVWAILYVLSDQ